MDLAPAILGHTASEKLRAIGTHSVLQIGRDSLTRGELADVGCYNFTAARILTEVLHKELRVKSLQQVYEEIPPSALALPRLGVTCLAVLGAAFEAKGIGGREPLTNYVKQHTEKVTTYHTMKQHAAEEAKRANRDARQSKRARKAKAHALRVERFETRQARQAS